MFLQIRSFAIITSAVFLNPLVIAISPLSSSAETFQVYKDDKLTGGRAIIGTGQNLPALSSSGVWAIGNFPKEEIEKYHNKQSAADQQSVADAAIAWTNQWSQSRCNVPKSLDFSQCRLAAVFDVDDTMLSSYFVDLNSPVPFVHNGKLLNNAIESCKTPVIEPVRKAYQVFRSWGIATFIVTGRSENQRKSTLNCLESMGMSEWEGAHFKPHEYKGSASQWKYQVRQLLINDGWNIGPSIGDQVSDMSYGSFTRGFLMPNVRYFIK